MSTKIIVENLKCTGCAQTIKKGLKTFAEVQNVVIDLDNASIEITHSKELPIEKVKEKLSSMGYPESGTKTGLDKMAANARSYVSCAIGKISKED